MKISWNSSPHYIHSWNINKFVLLGSPQGSRFQPSPNSKQWSNGINRVCGWTNGDWWLMYWCTAYSSLFHDHVQNLVHIAEVQCSQPKHCVNEPWVLVDMRKTIVAIGCWGLCHTYNFCLFCFFECFNLCLCTVWVSSHVCWYFAPPN